MFGAIKKIILWRYERGTWQYDLLCLFIIAFIFLTPNEWFRKSDRAATKPMVVVVKASDIDRSQVEKGIRALIGVSDVQIVSVKERKDASGTELLEVEVRSKVEKK